MIRGRTIEPAAAMNIDRAKQSFLAAMSHELRTPLNAIIGFAEIMESELLGPIQVAEYRDYLGHILKSSQHLLRLIEDVLEISRAETGELVLSKREVDLSEMVTSALAAFGPLCLARHIRVVSSLPKDVVIEVDPDRVRRIIVSLLSNAVKFSMDGGEVRIVVQLRSPGRVKILIRDHGIGMDPSAIERAFAPFIQLEDELSRPFDGSGLGLPLARLLAELHGGSVRLESEPGVGTTAIVELPAYSRIVGNAADKEAATRLSPISGLAQPAEAIFSTHQS